VFDAYLEGWRRKVGGTRPPRLDEKRKRLIGTRLKEFTVEDLKLACQGIWRSEFNLREGHYGIDLVLRDAAHVERFRAIAMDETASPAHRAGLRADDALRIWGDLYAKSVRKHGTYTPQLEDRAIAARYAEHAFGIAEDRANSVNRPDEAVSLARDLLAHWFKQYLREDGDRFAWRDAKHPFRWVDRVIPTAGVPWTKQRVVATGSVGVPSGDKSESPTPQGPPIAPEELKGLVAAMATGGTGELVRRPDRSAA
jgi:hypothetical protein